MKNVIIFGACSAIAQATARLMAKRRWQLTLIDRDEERLKIVADDLRVLGAHVIATHSLDLTNIGRHEELLNTINDEIARNASSENKNATGTVFLIAYGTLGDQKIGEKDFAAAKQELDINFMSVVSLLTRIANTLERSAVTNTATIAVISSVAGDRGRQSNYIYGTAKGALTIFLQGLRHRLARSGVHVLTIKPGFVDTPMTKDFKKNLLWVQPEVIARGIMKAIDTKKHVVYLPWFWRYIMLVIRLIPERIFQKTKL